jgi:hypothetical protein
MALAEADAEFAREVVKPGGAFLCKVLQGGTEATLLTQRQARQAGGEPHRLRGALFAGDGLPRPVMHRRLSLVASKQRKLGLVLAASVLHFFHGDRRADERQGRAHRKREQGLPHGLRPDEWPS